MKVFLLGHRGMLGHVLHRYLSAQGLEVLTTGERYTGAPDDKLIAAVRASSASWIINTIGRLDAKSTALAEMLRVNAQLPVHLKSFLRSDQRMIHASTDGVFSGRAGNYAIDAERDATDPYGFSKILGEVVAEPGRAFVIRTSIVGPPGDKPSGLMHWFLTQKGPVQGYTNHFWNGLTTLEWAKTCFEILTASEPAPGAVIQPACSKAVSKYELLQAIARVWNIQTEIHAVDHGPRVDRTLRSNLPRASIEDQLRELRDWLENRRTG